MNKLQPEMERCLEEMQAELTGNILPFWYRHAPDAVNGGFIGRMTNDLQRETDASKGLVLNARLLWTFSAAYHYNCDRRALDLAHRAFDYIATHFMDRRHGGAYWMLTASGQPLDARKKIYGQAFLLYALAEYFTVVPATEVMTMIHSLFGLLEDRALDPVQGGYFETYNSDWTLCDDQRLGAEDMNEKKSMNNHLHILEAWTHLYRVCREERFGQSLQRVIHLFLDRIIDPRHHFRLFFDEAWRPRSETISFGHDIEGSWLLCEAAETLGDAALTRQVRQRALLMAQSVLREGLDSRGALCYEAGPDGYRDNSRHFWCQAEAVVGFINAWELSGEDNYLQAALGVWNFIREYQVDKTNGEWFWLIDSQDRPDPRQYKLSEWKCPYHNSRACLEGIRRLQRCLREQSSRDGAVAPLLHARPAELPNLPRPDKFFYQKTKPGETK